MYPHYPQDLPYVNASVARFPLTPCGAAESMILSNGLAVRLSLRWSGAVLAAIAPGDAVCVYAARVDSAQLIAAVLIETRSGQRIGDGTQQTEEVLVAQPSSACTNRR